MERDTTPALITLTTDFGTRDPWVGAMKGVIRTIAPEATVLDLSHGIAPQRVLEGARYLAATVPYFPPGTIHTAVVDPGVGTLRLPIIAECAGQIIVCPDNGLLTILQQSYPVTRIHAIENPDYMLASPSATFHGRDIFAPAAAHAARGAVLASFGPRVKKLKTIDLPEASVDKDGQLHGEVIHVDRFGNCITNISREIVPEGTDYRVQIAAATLPGIHRTYGDVPPGTLLALYGSSGNLEIAVSMDNAARALQLQPGAPVTLYRP